MIFFFFNIDALYLFPILQGYFLHSSFSCAKLLAESAVKQGQKFCFNLSAPYICQEALDNILEILPHVDILFGNEAVSEISTVILFYFIQLTRKNKRKTCNNKQVAWRFFTSAMQQWAWVQFTVLMPFGFQSIFLS